MRPFQERSYTSRRDGRRLPGHCDAASEQSRGFTLMELLVVIAIISILAALLMPVLATAVDAARTTHCQNNLRQTALVMPLYADVYAGMLPTRYKYDKNNDGVLDSWTSWNGLLKPYLGGHGTYFACHVNKLNTNREAALGANLAYCPAYDFCDYVRHWGAPHQDVGRSSYWSVMTYQVNARLDNGVRLSQVRYASECILEIETTWHDNGDWRRVYFNPRHGATGRPFTVNHVTGDPLLAPSGGAPAARVDTSVKIYTTDEVDTWSQPTYPGSPSTDREKRAWGVTGL